MTSGTSATSNQNKECIADEDDWRWLEHSGTDSTRWEMTWHDESQFQRHLRVASELPSALFPWELESAGPQTVHIDDVAARPGSSIDWTDARPPSVAGLFESLGCYLRTLHDHPSPEGFGDPDDESFRHTFNAFMACELTLLNRRLQTLDDDSLRDRAIEWMARLRRELSAFHPHGKSTWTIGRPCLRRLAVERKPTRTVAIVDFGAAALRPPEYDLAALHLEDILDPTYGLAERNFWNGYGAAVTRDLERRIDYFRRLIKLEHLLGVRAPLPTSSAPANPRT